MSGSSGSRCKRPRRRPRTCPRRAPPGGSWRATHSAGPSPGRRSGWLSNYHLAVRDGDTFADVGKTFKGFTDDQFREMTERLRALGVADNGYTVRVRPEIVVEV